MEAHPLQVIDRGAEAFADTLSFQTQLLDTKIADRATTDFLIFVEHPAVYTVGRSVPFQTPALPIAKDVPWVEISRGGQATFHGPGQLVGYPIVDLEGRIAGGGEGNEGRPKGDVHRYLRALEDAIIHALETFGLKAHRREGLTGVWVNDAFGAPRKLASIGIGVRRWITYHGFALNIATNLDYFRAISPCGETGDTMTSLAELNDQGVIPLLPKADELKSALRACIQALYPERSQKEVIDPPKRKPSWLKVRAPGSPEYMETQKIVKRLQLVTVCEEAKCPNIGECWSHHTATFMIMGELCTRRCSFCSVKDGSLDSLKPLDALEPFKVAQAVKQLGLKHVVITSVNRDDLDDMGALHFDKTVRALAKDVPDCAIELLIPDMRGRRPLVEMILQSGFVAVLNHNVETVPRLYREVRPGAIFKRSLNILRYAKEIQPTLRTKSGVMVGLGETKEEVKEVMLALREIGCSILTVGQYLQPTKKQLDVHRFVTPEEFDEYRELGYSLGFSYVESGPFVRSSYHAWRHTGAEAPTTWQESPR